MMKPEYSSMTPNKPRDSRWRLVVALLTLVVLGLVVDRLRMPDPSVHNATAPADEVAMVRLQLQVDALQAQLTALQRSHPAPVAPTKARLAASAVASEPALPQTAVAPEAAQPAAHTAPPEDFAKIRAEAEAETQAVRQGLDGQLYDEAVDEVWAPEQEARILADIGDGQLGAAYIVDSQCRSTLCRVQIEHPEAAQLDRVMFEMSSKSAFAGRRLFFERADGEGQTGRMTVYVARAGQALPTDRLQASQQP